MPLNGSFRSKSRSPHPASPRPATFLPPSHYAEAGGLTPRRQDSSDSHSPVESSRRSAFTPIASNSNSSFEFTANSRPVEKKRMSVASAKHTPIAHNKKRELRDRERDLEQGPLTNLPLVEAQLLPSLRDTIDRMTRPPTKPITSSPAESNVIECAPPSPAPLSPPSKPLKSALRSPTPKLQLKSPRLPEPAPSPKPEVTATTPKRTRPRSRTDPGAPAGVESVPTSPRHVPASSIPRPRTNTNQSASSTPRIKHHERLGHESSSDLEIRCEREARDRRSLHVVNGVLSSESESSDGELSLRSGVGLGLDLNTPYQPRSSFASKLRARFAGNADTADEAAERRRKELLGLVKGIKKVAQPEGSELGSDVEFDSANREPPRVLVSSSSGTHGDFGRELERGSRPLSFWKRSRSHSPAPPTEKSASRSPIIRQSPRRVDEPHKHSAPSTPAALHRHSVYYADPPPLLPSPPLPETQFTDEEEYNLVTQSPESVYEDDEDEEWPSAAPPTTSSKTHLLPQKQIYRHSDDLTNSDAVVLALNSRLAAVREREAFGIPPSLSDCEGRERLSFMDSGSELARVGMGRWEEEDGGGNSRRANAGLSYGAEKLFRTLSGGRDPAHELRSRARSSSSATQAVEQQRFSSSSERSVYYEDEDEIQQSRAQRESWQTQQVDAVDEQQHELDQDSWQSNLPAAVYASVVDRHGTLELRRQETIHQLLVSEETFVSRLNNTIKLFVLPLRLQDSRQYIAGVPLEIAKLFDWLEDILHLHRQLLNALRRAQETQQPVIERLAESVLKSFVKQLEVYQPYLARLVGVAEIIARFVADKSNDFGEFVRIQESAKECGGWRLEALLVDPVTRLGGYPGIFRTLQEETPKTHVDYVATFVLAHATESMIQVMTEVKFREDEYATIKGISQRIRGAPVLAKRGRRLLHHGQLIRLVPVPGQPQRDGRERSGTTSSSDAPTMPLSPRFLDRHSVIPKLKSAGSPRPSMPVPAPTPLQVFVFTDLIVLASASSHRPRHPSNAVGAEEWTLLEVGGLVGVLSVSEQADPFDPKSSVLVLEVVALDLKRPDEQPSVPANASLDTITFRVPSANSDSDSEDTLKNWLSAFQQSSKFTIRAISMPRKNSDALQDSLSLPKSPSLIAQGTAAHKQEKEERDWWSGCFHEICAELRARAE
uniref:DH domain-containing protein n=1 Tax=Mycena chlorophos TaxID=658473 RepID=A0ABQ0L6Y6_MYCCL|nr:predicted protein [Mycena chlorophos]